MDGLIAPKMIALVCSFSLKKDPKWVIELGVLKQMTPWRILDVFRDLPRTAGTRNVF